MSVIIPAYNEERGLEGAVIRTYDSFHSLGIEVEVIVVDDHSTDRTGEIAEAVAARLPHVLVLHHDMNRGIGAAFRTGINHATKDFVIFVPVDNPLDTEDIRAYLERMGACDIVVGSRAERVGYTCFASFASFIYNRVLVPLLFHIGISDVNWIQVYRRSLFSDHTIAFRNDRIFFLVEILVLARKKHLIVAEVPARMKKRIYGRPTSAQISTMAATLRDMVLFFWQINVRKNIP